MKVEPAAAILGHFAVPGDKSISHRAVLLAAVGEGETRIAGFGRSADTESTIAAVRALGVRVYEADPETLRVFAGKTRRKTPVALLSEHSHAGGFRHRARRGSVFSKQYFLQWRCSRGAAIEAPIYSFQFSKIE